MDWLDFINGFRTPIARFAARMIVFGKIDGRDYHRVLGRFYGFPTCCINNYIYVERVLRQPAAKYMYDVHGHRHDLDMVLCNECHAIYQQYVGDDSEKEFYKPTTKTTPVKSST